MTQLEDSVGYIAYGAGDFDGEGSGHDFYGRCSLLSLRAGSS
eukprot:CAMPEP_0173112060 /NCGR_PEP_ID=MMETSP1102-20130122/45706_1 /TAXON_ID=49646 /ORGANISM="Geminigera sp., Strain Caron Lab Isolate" /LENGTH=41 /DNA_ID= /DNA_START= /DNA_END= /DNA_ORIENTATION=